MPWCPQSTWTSCFADAAQAVLQTGCSWLPAFADRHLPGFDIWTLRNKSVKECKDACEQKRLTDQCRSFDYIPTQRTCHLSRIDRYYHYIAHASNQQYHEIDCKPGRFVKLQLHPKFLYHTIEANSHMCFIELSVKFISDQMLNSGVCIELAGGTARSKCPFIGPVNNYGMPDAGLTVKSSGVDECQEACTAETMMHCSSVRFNANTNDCTMYTSTRDRYALKPFAGSVYYEKMCQSKTSFHKFICSR